MKKNTRISYSAVNTFKQCPSKMYLQKKYKPITQSSAFGFGSAIEAAIEALLKGESLETAYSIFKAEWKVRPKNKWEKAKSIFDNPDITYYGSDFDKELITDISIKVFDMWAEETVGREKQDYIGFVNDTQDKIKNEKPVGQKDMRLYNRIMWYSCRKKGPYMIKAFYDEILPKVEEVISCQKAVKITNEENDTLTGYIDFILKLDETEGPAILDLKTSGKDYTDHDLDASDQLRIYAAAEQINEIGYLVVNKKLQHAKSCNECGHVRENNRLTNCEKCYDKKKKTGGKYTKVTTSATTQILTKTLENYELDDTIEDFSEVLDAIKNGITWKNPASCFNYGKQCDYYEHCWKGKDLKDLKHLKKK